jgi:two-component system, LuxR family, sensor histidine kinase DctS
MSPRIPPLRQPRAWLWVALVMLVGGLLWALVYFAARYEADQEQAKLESDLALSASQVRAGFARTLQTVGALGARHAPWVGDADAARLATQEWRAAFANHREWTRVEWLSADHVLLNAVESDYWTQAAAGIRSARYAADAAGLCSAAWRLSAAQVSASYFAAVPSGGGVEVVDVCLAFAPRQVSDLSPSQPAGYVLLTLAMKPMLAGWIAPELTRDSSVAFTEADGTRLALHGESRSASRRFVASQLVDWGGQPVVLRMERGRPAADLFPNLLTALVMGMSLALIAVIALLGRDTRRRQRAEADLAQAFAMRKAMEDSLITGMRARDLQGKVTYINPAFCVMVGYSAEEILRGSLDAQSKPLVPYLPPYWPSESVAEYRERQAQRFSEGAVAHEGYESVFMRKDGTLVPVQVFESPLIDARGVQTGWMSTVLDMSAQRAAEADLRATQDRLQEAARLATMGEMASLVSHELNQPLAAIASYATGAMNVIATNAHQSPASAQKDSKLAAKAPLEVPTGMVSEALQRIAQQAERAGRVIRSVNDFVRQRPRLREAVDLHTLLDGLLPLVALQARAAGVQVLLECPQGSWAQCDRTMVEQVVLNLARNAVQAMDKPEIGRRELHLSVARTQNNWWLMRVADTGCGIPHDIAQQMFAPFFTTKADGLGLGLSLCRTVVEQHGGVLSTEAHAGGGTVFSFTLPPAAAAQNAPP